MTAEVRTSTGGARLWAIAAAVLGLGACAVVGFGAPSRVVPPYLVGFTFWTGISVGGLSLVMLHQLVGGEWGVPVRRLMEAAALTVPLMGLLYVPIGMNLAACYGWAGPHASSIYPELERKTAYLNPLAFNLRTAGCFLLWTVLAILMARWSRRRDVEAGPGGPSWWMSTVSGPGLALIFGAGTIVSVDWLMSREPDWYSTIYGAMVIVGWGLATLATMIFLASILGRKGAPLEHALTPDRLNDLGNLLLAFVMLWAYMAFSQFLIVWSGNLAEEIPWYLRRTSNGYQWVALVLIVFHFVAPFAVLLFRETKRRREALVVVAAAIAMFHVLDLAWLILPADPNPKLGHVSTLDAPMVLAATVGIGGAWLTAMLWFLDSAPAVTLRDPITGELPEPHGGHA